MSRTERLLTETLGAIGTDQVVPILTSVARDPNINIGIRNKAVEILGKKNPNEVAIAFAELLGDPNTNLEVREFAINTMKGVKEENLVLSLLNTYNMGKTQYYSLLNTMLAALGEFDDPEVKKAVIEIAHSDDYPVDIRKIAIKRKIDFILAEYIPTKRNIVARNFILKNNFKKIPKKKESNLDIFFKKLINENNNSEFYKINTKTIIPNLEIYEKNSK